MPWLHSQAAPQGCIAKVVGWLVASQGAPPDVILAQQALVVPEQPPGQQPLDTGCKPAGSSVGCVAAVQHMCSRESSKLSSACTDKETYHATWGMKVLLYSAVTGVQAPDIRLREMHEYNACPGLYAPGLIARAILLKAKLHHVTY
jgi:hypothetical protein